MIVIDSPKSARRSTRPRFAGPGAVSGVLCVALSLVLVAAPPVRAQTTAPATQPAPAAVPADATPAAVVEALHAALIASMRAGDEGADVTQRLQAVEPVIQRSYDFKTVARLVLGSAYRDMTEAQRSRFIDVFGAMTAANYASEFNDYNGHRFRTLGTQEMQRGVAIVRTELSRPGGKTYKFDYQLRRTDAGWKIVNVAVDGVSDLSMKRAQYTEVLEEEGVDALIDRLDARRAQLAGAKEADAPDER